MAAWTWSRPRGRHGRRPRPAAAIEALNVAVDAIGASPFEIASRRRVLSTGARAVGRKYLSPNSKSARPAAHVAAMPAVGLSLEAVSGGAMPTPSSSPFPSSAGSTALRWASVLWFAVAAVGQVAFIGFILPFYGGRTATGNFAAWNDKPLIDGHIKDDDTGNIVFATHVLLASVVTLGGLMQLIPGLRRRWPSLHRWTGRTFIVIAVFMALSGVWLAVVRGTYLSVVSAVAILINGLLILIFAGLAWRHAIKRRFAPPRRWALRTFLGVRGGWVPRVGLMGWVVGHQGPGGRAQGRAGPDDIVMTFGSYLIPLALLELHGAAERSASGVPKALVAALIVAASAFTAAGVFGTIAFMWLPHL